MNARTELFEKAPIPKAVATMGIPTIISMLVVVIYNMADTFFIGQTGDAMQVAAVSLATPVFMIFMALGNLFGIGGSSEISRSFGEQNLSRAKHASSFCFYTIIAVSIVMVIAVLAGMGPILKLIGASEQTSGYAREYLTYIALAGPFVMFSNCFSNIIRSEGSAKEAMIGNLIGTVVNIVLDPIMILWFGWGVAGAAIATVLGNIGASAYYLLYFKKHGSILSIRLKDYSAKDKIAVNILSIGIPASLNNILMSAANIILNNFLAFYGDNPVAGMGVAMKVNMLVVLLQIGLCMGVQPLIAYNYGAKNAKRMNKVILFTSACTVVLGTILTIVIVLANRTLIRLFINDADVIGYGILCINALMISGPVLGILFVCINTLQAMKKAIPSLILTICRQGLIFLPMIVLLNRLFGLEGIVYAQAATDCISIVLAVIISLITLYHFEKKLKSEGEFPI